MTSGLEAGMAPGDSRPFRSSDLELLGAAKRKYVQALLAFGEVRQEQLTFVRTQDQRAHPFKFALKQSLVEMRPNFMVEFEISSATGLRVDSAADNSECFPYSIGLNDDEPMPGTNFETGYYHEDASEDQVISFLEALFTERYVAARSYDDDKYLCGGLLDLQRLGPDPAKWKHPFWLAPPWLPKYKKTVLRHCLKSWHGRFNREFEKVGCLPFWYAC